MLGRVDLLEASMAVIAIAVMMIMMIVYMIFMWAKSMWRKRTLDSCVKPRIPLDSFNKTDAFISDYNFTRDYNSEDETLKSRDSAKNTEIDNLIARKSEKKWTERKIRDSKHIILFVGNEIQGQAHLDVKGDCATIQEVLAGSEVFHVIEKEGVKREDLVPLISKYMPSILHFDGHGTPSGELALCHESMAVDAIPPDDIKGLLNVARNNLKLAYFDSCYSDMHAKCAVLSLDASIGNKSEVNPLIARIFTSQFYRSLEDGQSIKDAFGYAKEHVKLVKRIPSYDVPILETRVGIDGSEIRFTAK